MISAALENTLYVSMKRHSAREKRAAVTRKNMKDSSLIKDQDNACALASVACAPARRHVLVGNGKVRAAQSFIQRRIRIS